MNKYCWGFALALIIFSPTVGGAAMADSAKVQDLKSKGTDAYQKGRYTEALRYYTEALIYKPQDSRLQALLVSCAQKILDQEADQEFYSPEELRLVMHQAEKILENRRLRMKKLLDDLKISVAEGRLKDPESMQRACRGVDLLINTNLGDDPESQELKTYIHSLCRDLEDQKPVQVMVKPEDLHRVLGYIAYCNSDWDRAVDEWKAALALIPQDAQLKRLLAQAQKRADASRVQTQSATLRVEGEECLKQKQYDRCVQIYEKIVSLDPGDGTAAKTLSQIRELAAVQGVKTQIDQQRRLALKCQKDKDWFSAAHHWLSVLDLDPLDAEARTQLRWVHKKISQELEAWSENTRPTKSPRATNSEKSEKHYTMGLMEYAEGRLPEAVKQFETSLKYDPANSQSLRALERLREEMSYQEPAP